jgi:hypothetical protein
MLLKILRRLKHRFVHCDLTNILVSLWTDDDHAIYPSEVQSEANVCNSCLLLLGGPNWHLHTRYEVCFPDLPSLDFDFCRPGVGY